MKGKSFLCPKHRFNLDLVRSGKELKILRYLHEKQCPAVSYVLCLLDGEELVIVDDDFVQDNQLIDLKANVHHFLNPPPETKLLFKQSTIEEDGRSPGISTEDYWFHFTKRAKGDKFDAQNLRAIVQREGFPIDKGYYAPIFSLLIKINKLNVFHTDIRRSNIMNFYIPTIDEKSKQKTLIASSFLIDYDLAEMGENGFVSFELPDPGARRDSIQQCTPKTEDGRLKWDGENENLMLGRALADLKLLNDISPLTSVVLSKSLIFPEIGNMPAGNVINREDFPATLSAEKQQTAAAMARSLRETKEYYLPSTEEINDFLNPLGLALQKVVGDGACFFSAVAVALNAVNFGKRSDWNAAQLRSDSLEYLRENQDRMFVGFDAAVRKETRYEYLLRMEKSDTYAEDEIIELPPNTNSRNLASLMRRIGESRLTSFTMGKNPKTVMSIMMESFHCPKLFL